MSENGGHPLSPINAQLRPTTALVQQTQNTWHGHLKCANRQKRWQLVCGCLSQNWRSSYQYFYLTSQPATQPTPLIHKLAMNGIRIFDQLCLPCTCKRVSTTIVYHSRNRRCGRCPLPRVDAFLMHYGFCSKLRLIWGPITIVSKSSRNGTCHGALRALVP